MFSGMGVVSCYPRAPLLSPNCPRGSGLEARAGNGGGASPALSTGLGQEPTCLAIAVVLHGAVRAAQAASFTHTFKLPMLHAPKNCKPFERRVGVGGVAPRSPGTQLAPAGLSLGAAQRRRCEHARTRPPPGTVLLPPAGAATWPRPPGSARPPPQPRPQTPPPPLRASCLRTPPHTRLRLRGGKGAGRALWSHCALLTYHKRSPGHAGCTAHPAQQLVRQTSELGTRPASQPLPGAAPRSCSSRQSAAARSRMRCWT